MLLLLQGSQPLWVTVVSTVAGIALGMLSALPWRSAAEAAKTERDSVREGNVRLREEKLEAEREWVAEKLELEKENAVLRAKTDLNGLRAEVMKKMDAMTEEFTKHSAQDLTTAKEQITALEAVKAAIEALHK